MEPDEEFPPVILALGGLRAALEMHVGVLAAVVDQVGEVKAASVARVSREGAKHDFLLFCIAKCCKTTAAVACLLDNLFVEETYPLTRTLYEHYLAVACVLAADRRLDEFLTKPIGLYAGTLQYPLSRQGKPIRREILHVASGIRIPGMASIRELAGSTGYKYDLEIHDILYAYLSQHTHPNMLASGNYRDETGRRYSYEEHSGILQAAFWAALASALMVSEVSKFIRRPRELVHRLREANNASRESLAEALAVLETPKPFDRMPQLVQARLSARRRQRRS